jgi:lipopolysaccharide/colanic/teichoic acid biosynthesis glycosyltransferase
MYDALKRVMDVVVAVLGLAISLPVQAVVAALVRLTLGRPVLFRQERPGLHGESFWLVKFRTMRSGTGTDEERLTRLGRILRSTSLDELPTLWNVLRGDMSLVGPRPLRTYYLDLYTPHQARHHEVRPGVTGLAQVRGRNALTWEQKFDADVEYVDKRGLLLDLKILIATARTVLSRQGVSAAGSATMPRFTGSPERDR